MISLKRDCSDCQHNHGLFCKRYNRRLIYKEAKYYKKLSNSPNFWRYKKPKKRIDPYFSLEIHDCLSHKKR